MEILYFDKNIASCIKPVGVPSEGEGVPKLLKEELMSMGIKTEVFPLHRLDMAVGGVMVFALHKSSAATWSRKIAEREGFDKEYLAVVHGSPEEKNGVFEDLLFKDSRANKSYIVKRERKGVKKASLEYDVLEEKEGLSLVKIRLHTGRTHQIRVQFSGRKMPLVGDKKYGGHGNCNIALFSHSVTLDSHQRFESLPESVYPWNLFDILKK